MNRALWLLETSTHRQNEASTLTDNKENCSQTECGEFSKSISGIKMHLGWSDHKWTALSVPVEDVHIHSQIQVA